MRRSLSTAAALAAAAAAPAFAQPAVSLNQPWTAQGTLAPGDEADADGRRYDEHRVLLPDEARFRIVVTSEDFDPVVEIRTPGGEEPLAQNDDGGDGFNPRLSFAPADAGPFVIRVIGFGEEAAGAYTLTVEALPPLPPATLAAPTMSQTMTWRGWTGAIEDSDLDADPGRSDDYALTLRAGEEVMIRVDSDSFDPMVKLFEENGRDGEPIAEDDDGGPDLNALLIYTPERTGRYVLRVGSYEGEGRGAYRVRIGQ